MLDTSIKPRPRVLLTGACGFVGSHLVEVLASDTAADIIALDGMTYAADASRLADLALPAGRVMPVYHDLRSPFPDSLIRRIGPVDYVVNVASASHVDRSIEEPAAFIQNNVALVCNVLDYCRRVKPRLVVQVSTDEVYGPAPPGTWHEEWEGHRPSNPYAASKAAQEDIAFAYWRTYGVPVLITNTMNNFGERQHPEKYLPKVVASILNGWYIPVHADLSDPDSPAPGSRHWLHARSHAEALVWLMSRVEVHPYPDHQKPTRYNIAGDVEADNFQIVWMAAEVLKRQPKYQFVDFHQARPGHDRRYALSNAKLMATGFRFRRSFKEDFAQTVRWMADNPQWLPKEEPK